MKEGPLELVNRVRGVALCVLGLALPAEAVNPRVEFALGLLAESRGEKSSAADHFEKARNADPLAWPLVDRAVRALLAEGNRTAAVKLYRDLAEARLKELSIQILYSDFLAEQGRGDALAEKMVSETLRAALKIHPGEPQLIRRLFLTADTAERGRLLGLLKEDDLTSVLLYASLAPSAYPSEDLSAREKLDQHLRRAQALHPKSSQLARVASDHFRNTKRTTQAIEILKCHVAAAPASLELRTRLGVLYFSTQQPDEGEAVLKEVLAIDAHQALAHQALEKFYRLREQADLARFHASELLKIRGGSTSDFLKLASEWLELGDAQQARILLEKAVFDEPENPKLARMLAVATRRDPETATRAARLFREAELAGAAESAEPSFLVESAEVLIAEGQGKAAEDRLRAAIKAFPPESKKESAAALRRLALLWENENRNLAAARSLRQRAEALDR